MKDKFFGPIDLNEASSISRTVFSLLSLSIHIFEGNMEPQDYYSLAYSILDNKEFGENTFTKIIFNGVGLTSPFIREVQDFPGELEKINSTFDQMIEHNSEIVRESKNYMIPAIYRDVLHKNSIKDDTYLYDYLNSVEEEYRAEFLFLYSNYQAMLFYSVAETHGFEITEFLSDYALNLEETLEQISKTVKNIEERDY